MPRRCATCRQETMETANCSVEIDHDEATEFHVWNVEGRAMQDDDRCACGAFPWSERGICVRKVTKYLPYSFFGWVEFEISAPVVEEDSGEMLSAIEAAERVGVSRWLVYKALGEMAFAGAVREGGQWKIPASSVDQWSRSLTNREQVLVAYVSANPGAKLKQIGELLGTRQTASKAAVDKLIHAGLLKRDQRGQLVVEENEKKWKKST